MKNIRVLFLSVHPSLLSAIIVMLNADLFILADADSYENLDKRNKKCDVVIYNDNSITKNEFLMIREDLLCNRNTPKIFYTSATNKDYLDLFAFGNIKGFVSQRADISTLKEAIVKVYKGEKYFCNYIKGFLSKDVKGIRPLTRREKEILNLSEKGLKNKEIAEKLFISKRTVDTHKQNIKAKLI